MSAGGSMLFLYRPSQTWMPYRLPRKRTEQDAYYGNLQTSFEATRRVPRAVPSPDPAAQPERDTISQLKELAELHGSGALSDAEFAAAKAKVIGTGEQSP